VVIDLHDRSFERDSRQQEPVEEQDMRQRERTLERLPPKETVDLVSRNHPAHGCLDALERRADPTRVEPALVVAQGRPIDVDLPR
jgi:hypothetical protein